LLHSHFVENRPIDLEAANPSFLRWLCHSIANLVSHELSTGSGFFSVTISL
jgi:hypothetical protein